MKKKLDSVENVFGASVKSERLRMHFTQDKLAELVGVDRATIQRIEAGSSTSLNLAIKVARTLETTIENLIPYDNYEDQYFYHMDRARFFRLYASFLANGTRPFEMKKSCLAIIKHPMVYEHINNFYKKIDRGQNPIQAMNGQDELCGGLQDCFTIAISEKNPIMLNQIIYFAEEEANKHKKQA